MSARVPGLFVWGLGLLLAVASIFVALTVCLPVPDAPPEGTTPNLGEKRYLEKYLPERMALLTSLGSELRQTMAYLGISLVLSLYLIRTTRGALKLDFVSIEVPFLWVKMGLPAVFVYWWLQWGYDLHRLVDLRIVCWQIIDVKEVWALAGADSIYSVKQLLRDNWFVDQWLLAFRDPKYAVATAGSTWIFQRLILVLLGLFMGAAQGVPLALLENSSREMTRVGWRIVGVYMLIIAALLLSAHLALYFGGPQKNWLQYVMLAGSIATFIWSYYFGRTGGATAKRPDDLIEMRCR